MPKIDSLRCRPAVVLACWLALLVVPASGQRDPQTALFERTGWAALEAGQPKAAAESFRQALAADPTNARRHLGAGTAAAGEHRDEAAKVALERALELDPRLAQASALLGVVLRRLGDLPGAIRAYERLLGDSAGQPMALATLDRWRRELDLKNRMDVRVGAGFTVSFEGLEDEALATRALQLLELSADRIADVLMTRPAAPIPVVLYTAAQFVDITRAPAWAGGAYDGTIRVPMGGALERLPELDGVLAHELVHAFVHSLAPRGVPTWLNEGLATALEAGHLKWAAARVQAAPTRMPLASLTRSFGRLAAGDAQLAYATSGLAAQRLLDDAGGVAVANLLRDLGQGVDFEAAFRRRIHRSLVEFEASLAGR